MDPGGFVQAYVSRGALGGLQLTDVQFVLIMLPLLSPRVRLMGFFTNLMNRKILIFLTLFTVLYHIMVFGYFAAAGSFKNTLAVLQYQRLTLFAFLAIVPAYIFTLRSFGLLVRIAFVSSLVLAILFVGQLITGFEILPTISLDRGFGISVKRYILISYGYGDWFIYISSHNLDSWERA